MTAGARGGAEPAPRWRLRSLASRMVLLGAVQCALFAIAAAIIFLAQRTHEPHPHEVIDAAIQRRFAASGGDRGQLAALLDEIHDRQIEASLYDAGGELIASNVEPALAIPRRRPPPEGRPPPPPPRPGQPRPSLIVDVSLGDARGVLVVRGAPRHPAAWVAPALLLICGLVIVIGGGLWMARWIVRPIERLSRTANALGGGDLAARSRIARADEIGELAGRIDDMAGRIEQLVASEKELLANVAHELRTPLTRIGVALDLAGEGDSDAARASLAEIAVDVGELGIIVDDILTAMRFESASRGSLPLRREVVPPDEIARAAARRLAGRHPERPFALEVAPGLPAIDVDPVLIRRVIDNLLENAHKYSPDPASPIALRVTAGADHVVFAVEDRGLGITEADLPHVFTAFFRGDRSRSRETGGVGLGLTLARRIAEAHGGTIELASAAGAGTTVRVAVPAAYPARTPRVPARGA